MQSSSSAPTGPFIDDRQSAAVMLSANSVTIESEDYTRAQDNDLANTGPCSQLSGPVDYYDKQPGQPGIMQQQPGQPGIMQQQQWNPQNQQQMMPQVSNTHP